MAGKCTFKTGLQSGLDLHQEVLAKHVGIAQKFVRNIVETAQK